MNDTVGLADAILAVREELNRAIHGATRPDQKVGFLYKEVEIQLELAITREGSAKGGVKFWVVSGELSGSLKSANTHRIKVILDPYNLDTLEPLRVVDMRALEQESE